MQVAGDLTPAFCLMCHQEHRSAQLCEAEQLLCMWQVMACMPLLTTATLRAWCDMPSPFNPLNHGQGVVWQVHLAGPLLLLCCPGLISVCHSLEVDHPDLLRLPNAVRARNGLQGGRTQHLAEAAATALPEAAGLTNEGRLV